MMLSPSSMEGAPLHWAWLSTSLGGAELTFGAFPRAAVAIRRNSLLTCAVGGGLEHRPWSLGLPPGNFLEGAVAKRS